MQVWRSGAKFRSVHFHHLYPFSFHSSHTPLSVLHMLCHFAKCDKGSLRLGHSLAGLLTYLLTKHQLQLPPSEMKLLLKSGAE